MPDSLDEDFNDVPASSEDSAERGFVPESPQTRDPVTYDNLGQTGDLDSSDIGDIADEGRGHRG